MGKRLQADVRRATLYTAGRTKSFMTNEGNHAIVLTDMTNEKWADDERAA
jgi:hypothetical protein